MNTHDPNDRHQVAQEEKGRKRTDGTDNLREKVVEILAATTNGCLSELGYFPGMSQKLEHALQSMSQLQTDNSKLYEDNQQFAKVVAMLKNTLRGQVDHSSAVIADLQNRVRALLAERAELVRQTQSAQSADISSQSKYQTLLKDFQYMETLYVKAVSELQAFRRAYGTPPVPEHVPVQTHALHGRRISDPNLVQGIPAHHADSTHLQTRSHSDNYVVGTSASPTMGSHVPAYNRVSVPMPVPSSSTGPVSHQNAQLRGWDPSKSIPMTSNSPTVQNPHPRIPMSSQSPVHPPVNTMRISQFPKQSRPRISIPNTMQGSVVDSRTLSAPPVVPAKYPAGDSAYQHPNFFQVPVDVTRKSVVVDLTNDEPDTHREPSSAEIMIAAPMQQPVSDIKERPDTASKRPSTYMDNANEQDDNGSTHKRQRPDPTDIAAAADAPGPSLDKSPVPSLLRDGGVVVSEGNQPAATEKDAGQTEEKHASPLQSLQITSDIDVIPVPELDEDGRPSLNHCLSVMFESHENGQRCFFCYSRFMSNAIPDPPKLFVNASLDELVNHCIAEHPAPWNVLRNGKNSD